jgi:DNA-binding NarL/FixJ family response regulator
MLNKSLSPYEIQILKVYIEECLSQKQLADRFNTKVGTMKVCLQRIRRKAGVIDAMELARWSIINGYAVWEKEG